MTKAFTLVELLLAMALLMIFFGIGVAFSYQAVIHQQVNQASQTIENALQTAREYAEAGKRVSSKSCISDKYYLAGWGVYFNTNDYELVEYCTTTGQFASCPTGYNPDWGSAPHKYLPGSNVSMPGAGTLVRNPVVYETLNRGICGIPPAETLTVSIGSFSSNISVD